MRSNGVVTYVGKDIANQFWKFGLLGRDFRYRRFNAPAAAAPDLAPTRSHGGHTRQLWATTSGESEPGAPPFGHARRIYNVIDSRQMYLQALLSQALRTLGHPTEAENSIHFSYEMVALSHATARELGYQIAEEDAKKPFVEVSGRKGLGVKIDDLLDLLTNKAAAEVARRNPELERGECERIGAQIAVAAIRYFMLKFSRGKLIVFDIEEALSFEGETGPYLQYAVVRAEQHPAQAARARGDVARHDVLAALESSSADELTRAVGRHDTTSGRSSSRRRAWTRSSNRSSGRWNSRPWRSTRSGWRRCSTRSTIGIRSSTKQARIESAGARPASPTSGRSSPARSN